MNEAIGVGFRCRISAIHSACICYRRVGVHDVMDTRPRPARTHMIRHRIMHVLAIYLDDMSVVLRVLAVCNGYDDIKGSP